ncbi:MAG: glycosyltransferase family 4 protein [Bacteroides sp.]|nr:glycosyltransferase family 4 protein [Bacteroides sp.]
MERIVIAKANALIERGFDVSIITTDQLDRIPYFPINKKIRQIDLNINYDSIQSQSFFSKLIKRERKIRLHKLALDKLCQQEQYDILISTYGNEINFINKIKGVRKRIAEIHFNKRFRTMFHQSKFRRLINRWIVYRNEKKTRKLDAFVCLTEEDSSEWSNLNNLHVIPNFISTKPLERALLNNKSAIAVGRLSYQKGFDLLLNSWKEVNKVHPDWRLDIYGGGELKQELLELREKLKLSDCIIFHDPTPDILLKIKEASMFCLSSRFEGLPMVLIEAMSCGVPSVSFDCKCGPKDIFSDNNAGILIPSYNTDEFAKAVCKLIECEPLRKEMGESAYREVDKYSKEHIIQKWINLFNSLLSV